MTLITDGRGAGLYIGDTLGRRRTRHDLDIGPRGRRALHRPRHDHCTVVYLHSGLRRAAAPGRQATAHRNELRIPRRSRKIASRSQRADALQRKFDAIGARYIDHEHTFLFLVPPKRELWKGKIRFVRGGRNLSIRLDYSSHSGGVGLGFWSEPKQLPLKGPTNFIKGEDVTIDVMALDDSKPKRFWRWKVASGDDPLVSGSMHHCRLAFIIDEHVVDDFAFVVTGNGDSNNLLLLGENHFAFAQKWRNGLLPVTKTPS